MANVDDDFICNESDNPSISEMLDAQLSRRTVLGGGVAAGVTAALGGVGTLLTAVPGTAQANGGPLFSFQSVPALPEDGFADTVRVPPGYRADVLIAWGDPVSDGPEFDENARNSALEQAWQWGMHNDGMVYFPIDGSDRGLLVQNHEYTDDVLLFEDGTANWDAEKTAKSLNAHGVGIVEVAKVGGKWTVVRPSEYARRITGQTECDVAGPAAGHRLLRTSADPAGRKVLGTLNNCAMGYTPWGTYLACEENFNGYFRKAPGVAQTELERRYGIDSLGFGYLWHLTERRFRVDDNVIPGEPGEPNEPNRFGWVTEIDPFDPNSTPVKRTALGRMKHEGAWVQEARDGRVVVYQGDDQQNEYIYRYVSRWPWRQSFERGVHPLDEGTLYVARFSPRGYGNWLPLTPRNPKLAGWSLADIMINTRGAADLVGATKMDRPEWIDTFPNSLVAIATLTNNSTRGTASGPAVDSSNPRPVNRFGHIIRWRYLRDWTENKFGWEIFALAGDPANPAHGATVNGDKYGSPDGIYVDPRDRIWIQTDVSSSTVNIGAYAGFGNNQMLAANPVTRETRRFLVGPNGCEVTGVWLTADLKTMFVGIQHPGEAPVGVNSPADPKRYSSWPDGAAGGRPRSATLVIVREDGGEIGS
jgi:secreted PhoX family phosphatase